MSLRNPKALFAEWDADARHAEDASQQNIAKAAEFRAAAGNHQREAGQAAEEEMRLLEDLTKAREKRDHHEQQKEATLAEAQRYAEQAKGFEDRAADKRTAIAVLQQAMNGNGNDQTPPTTPPPGTTPMPVVPVDPAGPTRVDLTDDPRMNGPMGRFNEAHDELPADQRDGEKPL